ncbi:MAG: LysR family transcriptional regulator [Amylibacter sp.]|nr:LysR family transcriptional regulator [Amylibacter sp.]
MKISLRHLHYFQMLCQYGHFGQAANAAAISQPALSVKIKELEEILGAPLIDRSIRPYAPTPFGTDILARANAILDQVTDLENSAHLKRGHEGRFNLGVIPTVAPYLLPIALPMIQAQLPDLDLRVREATTDELLAELETGQLDACILATDTGNPKLTDHPLFKDRFLLAIHEDQAKALNMQSGHISLKDVSSLKLLLLSEGHCFRDQTIGICRYASTESLNQIGASSLQTLLGLAAGGYGATLLPEIAVDIGLTALPIQILRLAEPEPDRTIRLVSKSNLKGAMQLDLLVSILSKAGNWKIQQAGSL